jgi:hypothetical protein
VGFDDRKMDHWTKDSSKRGLPPVKPFKKGKKKSILSPIMTIIQPLEMKVTRRMLTTKSSQFA